MGFPIDSKVLGLREVIKVNEGERYSIPIYQRPYSWEEKNIKDFLESIFDAFKEVNEEKCKANVKPVFFGTIQLDHNKDDNTLDIVDGQQRLTTFLLFLDLLQRNEIHPKEYIDCSKVIKSEKLKEVLNDDNIKNTSLKYYENRKLLKKEVEHFEKEFKEKNEFYTELKNFVLDNVYFVQLITEEMDLSEVVSVFNTINTTGLDLNATDIFKVRYYNYLRGIDKTKDWLEEINSCYQLIDDSNEKLGKDGRTDQTKFDMGWVLDIYKHIICAEFGWGFSEVSKSNQKFFDELFKGTSLTEQSDLSVLEFDTFKHIVDGFIDYWRWIENVRFNGEHPEIAKEIFSIYLVEKTRYKRYWTIPFVVAYFRAKAEGKGWSDYYVDSLRVNMYMFRFFLIYTVVNDRVINPVQNKVCDECFKWFKECSTDDIIKNIKGMLWSSVRSEDHEPKEDFYKIIKSGLFYNASRVRLVCTLSALLDEVANLGKSFICQENEIVISEQEIYEKFFHYAIYEKNKNPYDIEHIQARNNFSDNSDEFNGIGNLVVLDSHINKSIQDDAVSEKITEYKNSQYAAVRIEFMKEYESCRDWDIDYVVKRADEEIDKIKRFMDEE
ncbi:DUF262 domain-containing protein [Lachnoanaerobaculum umeaense]|uniref:DUF262 domain-containing protein n=1 Tax=Lachnoanaerobaculum umeaense TaxID=617123 RepID=A0A385Q2Q6_9FIRM|nr:DUF262 domain-containing protein [Lachnoanaerobaculum umeaense]AYA98843.1 DUF262 domain-containing protein [Lachnoanaerobaculum umeaense]PZW94892.1 uncharacterized protein DUF1524 [Lachnoanaerobaculum umeaense]